MGDARRRWATWRMLWAAPVLLLATGCFDPVVTEGLACGGPDELCPPGQDCFDGTCAFTRPEQPDAAAQPDAGADASVDCTDFAADHFDACNIPAPGEALILTDSGVYVLNTDTATLTDPGGGSVDITTESLADGELLISTDALRIGATTTLRAQGSSPLVVASWTVVDVVGAIDVSSNRVDGRGAGASSADCAASAAGAGESSSAGASGGGGGGFGTAGGDGGDGDFNGAGTIGGAAGLDVAVPALVRAGCGGGNGGAGNNGNSAGIGGAGGGAIQLTAAISITVSGSIHAGGAGGDLGGEQGGGGGGGSGGFIGMEAPDIDVAGSILAANGGGGGGGGALSGPGAPGDDASLGTDAAAGGAGDSLGGGDGGDGATSTDRGATATDMPPGGAGGGGGGVGFIVVRGAARASRTVAGDDENPRAADAPEHVDRLPLGCLVPGHEARDDHAAIAVDRDRIVAQALLF